MLKTQVAPMRCAGGAHVVCGLSNFSTHVMLQWCTGGAVVPLVPLHGVGTDRRSWTGVGTWDLGFGLLGGKVQGIRNQRHDHFARPSIIHQSQANHAMTQIKESYNASTKKTSFQCIACRSDRLKTNIAAAVAASTPSPSLVSEQPTRLTVVCGS